MGFSIVYAVYEEDHIQALTQSQDLALSIVRMILNTRGNVDVRIKQEQVTVVFELEEFIEKDKRRYDEPRKAQEK